MELLHLLIGLCAGGAIVYIWARVGESQWLWTFAVLAVGLILTGGITPLQLEAVERVCPQPTQACDAVKSGLLTVLATGTGITFVGGLIGAGGAALLFDENRKTVNH
jgi:hypothetical protein